jgi:hypothetical protein
MLPGVRFLKGLVAGGLLGLITACGPVVLASSTIPSPDGKLTATLERVDNGLGFGQGAVYDEVHVTYPWSPRFLWRHGNRDSSVVFYVESSYAPGDAPRVRWQDSHHITIDYPQCHRPGRATQEYRDIQLSYGTFSVPAAMYCSAYGPNNALERTRGVAPLKVTEGR